MSAKFPRGGGGANPFSAIRLCCFDTDYLLRFTKLVKCIPEFLVFFYCVLENRNISSKINRSKVTDYAALRKKNRMTTTERN